MNGKPRGTRGPRIRGARRPRGCVASARAEVRADELTDVTWYPAACAACASALPNAGSSEVSDLPATSPVTTVLDQTGWSG